MKKIYWCIVTNMGILDDPQTCQGIANEWEPCTPELFETVDTLMFNLVNNSDVFVKGCLKALSYRLRSVEKKM